MVRPSKANRNRKQDSLSQGLLSAHTFGVSFENSGRGLWSFQNCEAHANSSQSSGSGRTKSPPMTPPTRQNSNSSADGVTNYSGEGGQSDVSGLSASYDARIKVCAHSADVSLAEDLLREMQDCNQDVSVDTYNSIIHTCTQAGDLPRAEKYLQYMEDNGLDPNIVSYNSVINACADQGDAPRAEHWLRRMVARGMKPNLVTYGTICKVFARQGAVQQVEGIMQMLEDSDTPLNEYFYASLISACGACTPPDPSRAERALEDLIHRGLRPQSVKRALTRVLGDRRTSQLLEQLSRPHTGPATQSTAQGHGDARQPLAPAVSEGGLGGGVLLAPPPPPPPYSCLPPQDGEGGFRGDTVRGLAPVPLEAFARPTPGPCLANASRWHTSLQVPANSPLSALPVSIDPAAMRILFDGCSAADPPSKLCGTVTYSGYVPGATLLHFSRLVGANS